MTDIALLIIFLCAIGYGIHSLIASYKLEQEIKKIPNPYCNLTIEKEKEE